MGLRRKGPHLAREIFSNRIPTLNPDVDEHQDARNRGGLTIDLLIITLDAAYLPPETFWRVRV